MGRQELEGLLLIGVRCTEFEEVAELFRTHPQFDINSTGVLHFLLSVVSLDHDQGYDLRKGDLIVSLAFSDRRAFQSHTKGEGWQSILKQTDLLGGDIIFSRDYEATGRGVLDKPKDN